MRVTNEELFVWYERLRDKTMNSVCENFRSHFLQDEVVNIKSLFNKIKRVCDKIRDLKRRDKSKMKLDRCLAEEFHPPVLENNHDRALASTSTEKERSLVIKVQKLEGEKKNLKRKLENLEDVEKISMNYSIQLNDMEEINKKVKLLVLECQNGKDIVEKDFENLKCDFDRKEMELLASEQKLESFKKKYGRERIRNLNKKIRLRDANLLKKEQEIKGLKNSTQKLDSDVASLTDKLIRVSEKSDSFNMKVNDLKHEKISLQKKLAYCKEKLGEKNKHLEDLNLTDLKEVQRNCRY